jgi:CheY-like chemotaxis protein
MRLLYVEDNRINALLFEEAVRMAEGIELRIVEDGEQALNVAADWAPELLVIDSHLPDVTGAVLLQRLRQLPSLAAVPAIMCSADADPTDFQDAQAAGFCGYWTKPIDLQRVLADLRSYRDQPAA